jgi:hypothetical protein
MDYYGIRCHNYYHKPPVSDAVRSLTIIIIGVHIISFRKGEQFAIVWPSGRLTCILAGLLAS